MTCPKNANGNLRRNREIYLAAVVLTADISYVHSSMGDTASEWVCIMPNVHAYMRPHQTTKFEGDRRHPKPVLKLRSTTQSRVLGTGYIQLTFEEFDGGFRFASKILKHAECSIGGALD